MDLLCFQLLNNDDYWAGRMRCNDIELSLPNNKYIVCNISDISLFYHKRLLFMFVYFIFCLTWHGHLHVARRLFFCRRSSTCSRVLETTRAGLASISSECQNVSRRSTEKRSGTNRIATNIHKQLCWHCEG